MDGDLVDIARGYLNKGLVIGFVICPQQSLLAELFIIQAVFEVVAQCFLIIGFKHFGPKHHILVLGEVFCKL